jgi:hypothetical protein
MSAKQDKEYHPPHSELEGYRYCPSCGLKDPYESFLARDTPTSSTARAPSPPEPEIFNVETQSFRNFPSGFYKIANRSRSTASVANRERLSSLQRSRQPQSYRNVARDAGRIPQAEPAAKIPVTVYLMRSTLTTTRDLDGNMKGESYSCPKQITHRK